MTQDDFGLSIAVVALYDTKIYEVGVLAQRIRKPKRKKWEAKSGEG